MDTEEMLCEVISKLPAKSILRFKAVSKMCSAFPSQKIFLKKHSEHSLLMDDPCVFIQQHKRWGKVELHPLYGKDQNKNYGVPITSLKFLYDKAMILGSYNGILVLKNMDEEDMGLFLCNLATQKFISIPKLTTTDLFGVHIMLKTGAAEFLDNYEVIVFKPTEDWSPYTNFYTYTKGEQWKQIGRFNTGGRNMLLNMPVYCKGAIHFISDTFSYFDKASPDYKPYIIACEIDKMVSRRIKLPKKAIKNADDETCNMRIFIWGKPSTSESTICLVRLKKSVFTVWILEDYEVGWWTLILKTRIGAMGLKESDPIICGFTVMNGSSLLFVTDKCVYQLILSNETTTTYSIKAEMVTCHGLGGCPSRRSNFLHLISCANTLRPCGNEELSLTSVYSLI